MKIALTACAVLLTVAGLVVVSGDLLLSAGYFGSSRSEPDKHPTVIPPHTTDPVFLPVQYYGTEAQTQHWLHEGTVRVFTESQGFGAEPHASAACGRHHRQAESAVSG